MQRAGLDVLLFYFCTKRRVVFVHIYKLHPLSANILKIY